MVLDVGSISLNVTLAKCGEGEKNILSDKATTAFRAFGLAKSLG